MRSVLTFVMIWCSCIASFAQTGVPGLKSFESYRGVRMKNIFDPERRGPRLESAPVSAGPPRANVLSLTGTMVTEGRSLAFFSGSSSDLNRVAAPKEKVGDYTVTEITSSYVKLDKDGTPLQLPVGRQLSLDGSGTIAAADPSAVATGSSSSSPAPSTSATTPPPGVPADKAEVLRRMMERRNQETSR